MAVLREVFSDSDGGFAWVWRTMQPAEPVPASELLVDLASLSLDADEDAPMPALSMPEILPSASPSSESAGLKALSLQHVRLAAPTPENDLL